jgi:Putative general bacterial porin
MSTIRHLTLPAVLAALLPMGALADDYRAEVGLDFTHTQAKITGTPDIDALGVAGTYYFSPVSTDGLPFSEAAFLNRSSFVSARASRIEAGDFEADIYDFGAGYYLPGTMFYGELGVSYSKDFGSYDTTYVSGRFGITPLDGLQITTFFDEDGWDPNLSAKYVGKLPNAHFYAAGISLVDVDDDDVEVGLEFDYFFDPTFSVGTVVSEHAWAVRAEKFFTPSFAVGANVFAGDGNLGDGIRATVSWRF